VQEQNNNNNNNTAIDVYIPAPLQVVFALPFIRKSCFRHQRFFCWVARVFCCLPVAGSSHIAQSNSNNFRSKGDIHDTISSGVISYDTPFLLQWHFFSRND